jgi:hypothetical protein
MLAVADVARLACASADEMAHAIAAAGCARIWLSASVWCLIDVRDYPRLSQHTWNCGGHSAWKIYAKRNTGSKRSTVYLHRDEVLAHHDPRDVTFMAKHAAHHRNGQSLDCRLANLEWLPGSVNSAIRNARAACPSLESIVARLAREAGPLNVPPF